MKKANNIRNLQEAFEDISGINEDSRLGAGFGLQAVWAATILVLALCLAATLYIVTLSEGAVPAHSLLWALGLLGASLVCVLAMLRRYLQLQLRLHRRFRSETALRHAMEGSQAFGMQVTDLEGRIVYVNRTFEALTSYSAGELIGTLPPYPYARAALDSDKPSPAVEKASAEGVETPIVLRSGAERTMLIWATPLVDPVSKEPLGSLAVCTDVTEARKVRAQLASSFERFTTVLQSLDAAVSVVCHDEDRRNVLLFGNNSYLRHFGNTAQGHNRLLSGLSSTTVEENGGTLGEVLVEETAQWFDVRVRTIRWTDGRKACLQIASNITERKKVQKLLEQQQINVEKTSRLISMGEMASSIAHEINQPLAAISNYAGAASEMLQSGRLSQKANLEAFDRILKQAQRTALVIKRVRSFVKRSEPNFAPAPIPAIVDSALELARIEAKRHGVLVRSQIAEGLPELYCDRVMIEQLVLNLVKNAAEASAQSANKTVLVEVTRSEDAIQFAIIDHGSGVPPEMKERLFESFFSTKSEGLGIGLNICRSIIEAHLGRLACEDTPGGGTTFRFAIPLKASKL